MAPDPIPAEPIRRGPSPRTLARLASLILSVAMLVLLIYIWIAFAPLAAMLTIVYCILAAGAAALGTLAQRLPD